MLLSKGCRLIAVDQQRGGAFLSYYDAFSLIDGLIELLGAGCFCPGLLQLSEAFSQSDGANLLLGASLLHLSEAFSQTDGVEQASATEFVTSIQKFSLSRRCEQASAP